jgi:hypothetical protein
LRPCRHALPIVLVVALGAAAVSAAPQAPPTSPLPATDYVFRSDAGLLVFHVRQDRSRDFEVVMARITDGLAAAADPTRRQQKAGLRVFRSTEVSGAAVYLLLLDPVVAGADYDPVRMVTEMLPSEASALYERLREAVVKVERVGLSAVR